MKQLLILFILLFVPTLQANEFSYAETIISEAVDATEEIGDSMNQLMEVMPFNEIPYVQHTDRRPKHNRKERSSFFFGSSQTDDDETIESISPEIEVIPHAQTDVSHQRDITRTDFSLNHEESSPQTHLTEKNTDEENSEEASSEKGSIIFRYSLKKYCHFTGDVFAKKYTQEEWEEIGANGEFEETLYELCPTIKGHYKEEWTQDLYQFSHEYASDSDNIPEC